MKWEQHLESLKTLIQQYKITKDAETFGEIVKRLEGFIIETITNRKRYKSYLSAVSLNDLYQTAILGLFKALQTMPPEEDSIKIPAWVKAYITAEIKQCYCKFESEVPVSQITEDDENGEEQSANVVFDECMMKEEDSVLVSKVGRTVDEVYVELEYEICTAALNNCPRIKKRDRDIFIAYCKDGQTYAQIAKVYSLTDTCIMKVVKKTRQRLLSYLKF